MGERGRALTVDGILARHQALAVYASLQLRQATIKPRDARRVWREAVGHGLNIAEWNWNDGE